jgi:hypothetical protein
MNHSDNGSQVLGFEQQIEQWRLEFEPSNTSDAPLDEEKQIQPFIPIVDVSNVVSLEAARSSKLADSASRRAHLGPGPDITDGSADTPHLPPQPSETDSLDYNDPKYEKRLKIAASTCIAITAAAVIGVFGDNIIRENKDSGRETSPPTEREQTQGDFNPKNPGYMR